MKKRNDLKQEDIFSLSQKFTLGKIYKECFLEYASYVICDRAIPNSVDGLKPVQRRILYSMSEKEDGRYHKVANIIGHTMQYHPHGDAAISDALVKLGQKSFVIDCQGNWGNICTGDSAAAARYIEARLTPFAKDILFSKEVTLWQKSYDNRALEPKTLPIKFPLLLLLGTEGIAVGLSTKILPHNFFELIQESIAILEGFEPQILPDFVSGGSADFSQYQDGRRGGRVKIRAKLDIMSPKLIKLSELPFGVTTSSLIDSILKASDKGKLRIKKIEDNTAEEVEILIHIYEEDIASNVVEALFVFSDCEVQYSTNCCVIENEQPLFLSVSEYLKKTVENTKNILKKELEYKIQKQTKELFFLRLESSFIEEKIYLLFESSASWQEAIQKIKAAFLQKKICQKDDLDDSVIEKLSEIKIKRISKFDQKKSREKQQKISKELKQLHSRLKNIIPFAIEYYKSLKEKYAQIGSSRKTKIESFVELKNKERIFPKRKIFIDNDLSYAGFELKNSDILCEGSEASHLLVVSEDGFFRLVKVSEKSFLGKNNKYVTLFDSTLEHNLFDVIILDKETNKLYAKRIKLTQLLKGKDYAFVKSCKKMHVFYFSKVETLTSSCFDLEVKDKLGFKSSVSLNFEKLIVDTYNMHSHCVFDACCEVKIIKKQINSTFSEQRWWYDKKNNSLNDKQKGFYLGKLSDKDYILQIYLSGKISLKRFHPSLKFEDGMKYVSKIQCDENFYVIYEHKKQKKFYVKKFNTKVEEFEENLFFSPQDFKIHKFLTGEKTSTDITYIHPESKKIIRDTCHLKNLFIEDSCNEKKLPYEQILSLENMK